MSDVGRNANVRREPVATRVAFIPEDLGEGPARQVPVSDNPT